MLDQGFMPLPKFKVLLEYDLAVRQVVNYVSRQVEANPKIIEEMDHVAKMYSDCSLMDQSLKHSFAQEMVYKTVNDAQDSLRNFLRRIISVLPFQFFYYIY